MGIKYQFQYLMPILFTIYFDKPIIYLILQSKLKNNVLELKTTNKRKFL